MSKPHTWIYSRWTVSPRRGHGSDCGSSGVCAGVPGMGDGGGVLAQPLLEDVHRGRQRHHHLHHLRKPVDVVRDGLYRGAQLQGIPVAARFEWYVPSARTSQLRSGEVEGGKIDLSPSCQVTSRRLVR